MIQLTAFAAVSTFQVEAGDVPSGTLRGFAAPAGGPRPCALVLAAGPEAIAVAQAGGFSPEARQCNLRLGWCGFSVGGLAQGLALGRDLELRCMVSDRVLGRWDAAELAAIVRPPPRTWLSVADLRVRLQAECGCTDISQVLPFAQELARSRGLRAALAVSYRYLLGREMDRAGETQYLAKAADAGGIAACWAAIMDSEEFRYRSQSMLPGPFEPGFPFPLDTLDAMFVSAGEKIPTSTENSIDQGTPPIEAGRLRRRSPDANDHVRMVSSFPMFPGDQ